MSSKACVSRVKILDYTFNNASIIEWLIIIYGFTSRSKLICTRHHNRWWAAKFRPTLGAQWDLYPATPAVTRGLGFSGLIWRTTPYVASNDTHVDAEHLFKPGSSRVINNMDNSVKIVIFAPNEPWCFYKQHTLNQSIDFVAFCCQSVWIFLKMTSTWRSITDARFISDNMHLQWPIMCVFYAIQQKLQFNVPIANNLFPSWKKQN
jgi:hypothetical protein